MKYGSLLKMNQYSEVKIMDPRAKLLRFQPQLLHLQALWQWGSFFTSLSLFPHL